MMGKMPVPPEQSEGVPSDKRERWLLDNMNYAEFEKRVGISVHDFCMETFARNRSGIRIKKEKTAVKNLARIFDATLKIANQKGFQAMTIRDLSNETGLSMGALYAYFPGKEELLEMLQGQARQIVKRILEESISTEAEPVARLRAAIRTHLYLTECMQPWFYFSYMETRHLTGSEREQAIASELYTEHLLSDILRQGEEQGVFVAGDHQLTASLIKAMLQDWYLKRWKYAKRKVSVDRYAQSVLEFVEAVVLAPESGSSMPRES